METANLLQNELHIDARVSSHLKETAGWARFLGIIGILLSILIIIAAFLLPEFVLNRMGYNPFPGYDGAKVADMLKIMFTSVYLVMGLILFFSALFTLQFGSKIKTALATNDQLSLDKGLKNLKFLFRFQGILLIIWLCFIALCIVLGIIGSAER